MFLLRGCRGLTPMTILWILFVLLAAHVVLSEVITFLFTTPDPGYDVITYN